MKAVCVFCGSSVGARPEYVLAARAFGAELARRQLALVYGGGNVGLMGALADAVLDGGGRVIGVIPFALAERELAHSRASEMHVVRTMHERKARMAELSNGFVALPGGFGTFEEICEMITWAQLGIHRKPCGVVNVAGYFDGLLCQFDRAVADGLLREGHRGLVVAEPDPERLLDHMAAWQPPPLEFHLDWSAT